MSDEGKVRGVTQLQARGVNRRQAKDDQRVRLDAVPAQGAAKGWWLALDPLRVPLSLTRCLGSLLRPGL